MNHNILKKNIEYLMKKKGFNMKSLSLAAGLNETAIRDLLKRTNNPSYQTINKLSKFLEIDPYSLTTSDAAELDKPYPNILDFENFALAIEKIDNLIKNHNLDINSKTKAKVYMACYHFLNADSSNQNPNFNQIFDILKIANN